jgi:hypothetical protein
MLVPTYFLDFFQIWLLGIIEFILIDNPTLGSAYWIAWDLRLLINSRIAW